MKSRKKASTNPNKAEFIKCVAFSYILYIIFFIAISFVILFFDVDSEKYYYISITQLAITSFISAFNCGFRLMKNGMLVGLLCALPAILTVFFVSIIMNSFKINFSSVISLIITMISAMLGGVLSVNVNIKHRK